MRVFNPATGTAIETLTIDSPTQVEHKLAAAAAAQRSWTATPLNTRIKILHAFATKLSAERDRLATLLTHETGKPIRQARAEISGTVARIAIFCDQVENVLCTDLVTLPTQGDTVEHIGWEPLGVVANISAWNYPYFVGSNVLVPALLTGNAVVYKPSEHAVLTGLAIGELLHASGVPQTAFQVVVGTGVAGAAMVQPPVSGVWFTGSLPTGKQIAAAAAQHLLPVQLELGGKDPLYVADDAEPTWAATVASEGAFYNCGQSCCAVERVYVHAAIYDAFVAAFVAEVRGYCMGDPLAETTFVGPLCRAEQVEVLEAQIRDAVAKGAKVLLGGKRIAGPGSYFEPTVLAGVDHSMALMREESFGPVIGIQSVSSDEEATALMADTEYGLTASVLTPDLDRARRILKRVPTGTSYWNCCDRVSAKLPWSGRKHSGLGMTCSPYGMRAFVRPRAWHLREAPTGG